MSKRIMHQLQRYQAGALLLFTSAAVYMLATADLSAANFELAKMIDGVQVWLNTLHLQGV